MDDYDALIALWKEAGLKFKPKGRDSREDIGRQLKLKTAIYLVAEVDGRMVGAVLGTHDGRKGWINRLAIIPSYQGQGVGRRLVEELERGFSELGIGIIASLVENWNKVSLEAAENYGYKKFEGVTYFTKKRDDDI